MALLPARKLVLIAGFVAGLLLLFGLRRSDGLRDFGKLRGALPVPHAVAGNTDAVLYVHYDGNAIGRRNFEFFIKHALHSKADFYFIINGFNLSTEVPEASNIHIIRRENSCYDLGTFGVVLQQNEGALMKKYKRFILMNSSVRGPFFPNWARLAKTACWTNQMFAPLSDTTKLVGLTVSCEPTLPRHMQSFALATDIVGLQTFLPALQCFGLRQDAIDKGELVIAQKVRDAGYDAVPLYAAYAEGGHSTKSNAAFWENCVHQEIFLPERYFKMDVHPFDTLFVKIHREDERNDVYTDAFSPLGMNALNQLTQWADDSDFSSYEQC
jgi:hypothetical protein